MYKVNICKLLSSIDHSDCITDKDKFYETIQVGSNDNKIIFGKINNRYYFSVKGGPYLIAMAKWVQQMLNEGHVNYLEKCNINRITKLFSLPNHNRRDALLILNLIESVLNDLH